MKYIAFYDFPEYAKENRTAGVPSRAVCKYMMHLFGRIEKTDVYCPIRTLNSKGIYKGRRATIRDNISISIPFSFGTKTIVGRMLVATFTRVWLLIQLLIHANQSDTVVAYHSMSFIGVIRFSKWLKHYKLIEEIREVYADINEMSARNKKREQEYFQLADSYIFATELLNQQINQGGKPYVIAPAVYTPEKIVAEKYSDNRIHLVYAGTFRKSKGGVDAAIAACDYLDERYCLHVYGTGSDERLREINNMISKNKSRKCEIRYEGVLYGDEFTNALQQCHIGLSTQNPEGAYNNTSFPSKIMTYLANGLDVLSVRIPAVETCPVGEYVYYYDDYSPQGIAEAVMQIDISQSVNKSELLLKLDEELLSKLRHDSGFFGED